MTALPVDADIAPTALLLADRARLAMLWALSDGRALPAGELAAAAGVRPSTASEHLARLVAGGLLTGERHGRHRFYRLVHENIVAALEALAVASPPAQVRSPKRGYAVQRLRLARSCYDHLAGALGVGITDALVAVGALRPAGLQYHLTDDGAARMLALGLDVQAMSWQADRRRRALARACLDWSERRYHVAGVLGAALFARLLDLRWVERMTGGRALRVTASGRRALREEFGVVVDVEVRRRG